MHRNPAVSMLGLVAALAGVTPVDAAPSPGLPVAFAARSPDRAVSASNQFGFELYAHLKNGGGNLICSPISASIALAMTAGGARGPTLVEMSKALHLDPTDLSGSHASFGSLLGTLNRSARPGRVQLQVVDRLWGQKGLAFKPDFLNLLEQHYQAPLAPVDFKHDAVSARVAINEWTAAHTHDRIPEFLAPGTVTAATRLVLINAVYFKGRWAYPFRRAATTDLPFLTAAGPRTARTMTTSAQLKYAAVPGATLVELPYYWEASMVVILPDAVDGLDELERRIGDSLPDWLAALSLKRVDVQLPRWKAASDLRLKDALATMGVRTALGGAGDFTGIADRPSPHIDQLIQQAFVEVDEIGTEAAGATAIILEGGAGRSGLERVAFRADHPFMYVIRDNRTGAILFLGRVVEPRT